MNLPKSGSNNIVIVRPIATIGDLVGTSAADPETIEVKNTYYYYEYAKNSNRTPKYITLKSKYDIQYLSADGTTISNGNLLNVMALSYDDMKNGHLLNRLKAGEPGFANVTTTENGGARIDGKYSFPGSDDFLKGENYPFPTILKQGNSINVHYGEWPREGIYWDESRASMDIFEDLQLEGDNKDFAVKTFKLLDPKPVLAYNLSKENFTITYSNGEKEEEAAVLSDNVADSQFTASPVGNEAILEAFSSEMTEEGEDGFASGVEVYEVTGAGETDAVQAEEPGTRTLSEEERIAEIMEIRYDDTEKCYLATVKALKTGATIITVSTTGIDNQPYMASFNLNVSADLSVFATPESVTQKIGQSQKIILHAVPTAQLSSAQAEAAIESVADSTSQVQASDGWTANSYSSIPNCFTISTKAFTAKV